MQHANGNSNFFKLRGHVIQWLSMQLQITHHDCDELSSHTPDAFPRNKRLNPEVTEAQLRAELERSDPSASGVVSEQDLGKALARFGAEPRGTDLGRLMHRFDLHEVKLRTAWKFTRRSSETREHMTARSRRS